MPKVNAHATDRVLLDKGQRHLLRVAKEHGQSRRQKFNRIAPRLASQTERYVHAKQFERIRPTVWPLRLRVRRVQVVAVFGFDEFPERRQAEVRAWLARNCCILTQRIDEKSRVYALHTSEGKARTAYEFGLKVSCATAFEEALLVEAFGMPSDSDDAHSLSVALEDVGTMAERKPVIAILVKGGQCVEVEGVRVLLSGQKRSFARTFKAMMRRRGAAEPAICPVSRKGRVGGMPLRGSPGDVMHIGDVRHPAQPVSDLGCVAALFWPTRAVYSGGYRYSDWTQLTAELPATQSMLVHRRLNGTDAKWACKPSKAP